MTNHSQLGGDHERADRVIGRSAAGVADHMGVAFGKACILGGVEPGVHAGEDGKSPRGRHGELALVAETGRIAASTSCKTGAMMNPSWRSARCAVTYSAPIRILGTMIHPSSDPVRI
jgi:hypothetical protein